MLHLAHDNSGQTADAIQGSTIHTPTLVHIASLQHKGQLTVALTRNTNPDDLHVTSCDIRHIAQRPPVIPFVKQVALNSDHYAVL